MTRATFNSNPSPVLLLLVRLMGPLHYWLLFTLVWSTANCSADLVLVPCDIKPKCSLSLPGESQHRGSWTGFHTPDGRPWAGKAQF